MRALRRLPLALALVVLASPAISASAMRRHGHCTVPHGWRVVAKDHQAVVIGQRRKQYPAYDYCNWAVGSGWRRLVTTGSESFGSFFQPASPLLAGRYVADAVVSEPPQTTHIDLWDTRSGQHSTLTVGGPVASFSLPTLLLSPSGVAAAVVITSLYTSVEGQYIAQPPSASIQVLTLHTQGQTLDSASPPSDIANLQLYGCAAGCATNTTLVAWTDNGAQRSAQVQGGG